MRHICYLRLLGIAIITLLLGESCTTVQWTEMERLKPAKKDFPNHIRRVAVVNNHIKPIQSRKRDALFWPDSRMIVDSLAANLADANYFDEVVVLDSFLTNPTATIYDNYQLTSNKVNHLANILDVDMLISLELALFIPKVSEGYGYQPGGQVLSLIKIYQPGLTKPSDTLTFSQNFYWDNTTSEKEIRSDIIEIISSQPLPYLVPQWEIEEFPYYTNGNMDMRDAAIFVKENNWEMARLLWEKTLSDKKRSKKMRANMNMAIWYEINSDSIEVARSFAQKALDLASYNITFKSGKPQNPSDDYLLIADYLRNLGRREKELKRLKEQMQRFSDDL